ncbi:endonuclease V [Ignicoccus hospitalis]|uniref:Endonuclease V n=1 Tax=Ignicoccus hospitalis (strain KIN4/I / DSM 18386 / JCM 14125) TaxID=453591 RepID=NFI_IGNH4|nr:endonuclease V [Ignicoccus hospitalis]A8A9B8.1 RecName: Full=Endonuclease V; AltName: Full=Deoxyinosine 3'endonuclease; AltName: Full=Deoxyribonuclease V; Short=DNase V [Ignicoccus hospitalis KIN4/I]ABU81520.1 Endonuclease V [Ignicoccus hospitalis KIN4/I]HIH90455.1 endonuclease V [Desulfurococcaceae archaeon]
MTFDRRRASELQRKLSELVKEEDCFDPEAVEAVGGLDVSYKGDVGVSALSLIDYKTLRPLKHYYVVARVPIPYVPGFLAFREAPLHLTLIKKVKGYDLLLVDGHGRTHPRGLGIASHVGVTSGVPTVGVAKRRLVGEEERCGERECLVHEGKVVAYVIRRGKQKLYVSVGHCVSLETAYQIVKRLTVRRLPEPIAWADRISRSLARSLQLP